MAFERERERERESVCVMLLTIKEGTRIKKRRSKKILHGRVSPTMVVLQTAVRIHILNHIPINNNNDHHHQQTAAAAAANLQSSSTSEALIIADEDCIVSDPTSTSKNVHVGAVGRGGDQIGRGRRKGRRRYYNDDHATVYIQYPSSSSTDDGTTTVNNVSQHDDQELLIPMKDGSIFGLYRRISGHDDNNHRSALIHSQEEVVDGCIKDDGTCMLLWVPVIVKLLPPSRDHNNNSFSSTSSTTSISNNTNDDDAIKIPNLYIPPCLASTLGIHFIHDTQQQQNNVVSNSISIAYLQPLPKNEIVKETQRKLN